MRRAGAEDDVAGGSSDSARDSLHGAAAKVGRHEASALGEGIAGAEVDALLERDAGSS